MTSYHNQLNRPIWVWSHTIKGENNNYLLLRKNTPGRSYVGPQLSVRKRESFWVQYNIGGIRWYKQTVIKISFYYKSWEKILHSYLRITWQDLMKWLTYLEVHECDQLMRWRILTDIAPVNLVLFVSTKITIYTIKNKSKIKTARTELKFCKETWKWWIPWFSCMLICIPYCRNNQGWRTKLNQGVL